MLNAIFYLVKQGGSWRDLPSDFPAWQTVYKYHRAWVKDGTWDTIHNRAVSERLIQSYRRTRGSQGWNDIVDQVIRDLIRDRR